jgi:PAS domain S-box-containing protein
MRRVINNIWNIGLILILFFGIIKAQGTNSISFDKILAENTLPSSSVDVFFKDSKGLLWIGTENGLCFFDGYKFHIFQNEPNNQNSISDNWILAINEDTEGNIWVGTHSGGINKYDKKTAKFYSYKRDENSISNLKNNRVWTIFTDKDGSVYYGSSGGFNVYDKKHDKFINFANSPLDSLSLSNDAVNKIFKDSNNNIWIGTFGGGLNKLIKTGNTFIFEKFYNIPSLKFVANSKIKSIAEDKNGILWLGTFDNGLIRFDYKNKTEFVFNTKNNLFPDDRINSLIIDKQGNLLVGTNKKGLIYIKKINLDNFVTKQVFEQYTYKKENENGINDNTIISIYEDYNGIIWIGGNRGINKVNRTRGKFVLYKNNPDNPFSISEDIIKSLFQDSKGNFWVGTYHEGLNKLDLLSGKAIVYKNNPNNPNSLSNNSVWVINEDIEGNIWVGTSYGLNKIDFTNNKYQVFLKDPINSNSLCHNNISALKFIGDGYLWIGTWGGGISIYDLKANKFYNYSYDKNNPFSISNDQIKFIFEDSEKNIWIGTLGGGLNKVEFNGSKQPEKLKFIRFINNEKDKESLSSNSIISIFEDNEKNLYVGTFGGGLNKFNLLNKNNLKCEKYFIEDGLPGNTVYAITSDNKGYIWLSTNNGISRFDPKNKTFTNFNKNDGLQGNDFEQSVVKLKDGRIGFGGYDGFNLFNPEDFVVSNYSLPIILTSVKIGDEKEITAKDLFFVKEITLLPGQKTIKLEFAALDFNDASKVNYKFMMEGFDKDWQKSGTNRYAFYTNLNYGTYKFKIKATNSNGLWSDDEYSIIVIVKPPFYLSTAAFLVYIAIILAIVIYILRKKLRIKRNLETNKEPNDKKYANKSNEKEINDLLYQISDSVTRTKDLYSFIVSIGENLMQYFNSYLFVVALYNNFESKIEPISYKSKCSEKEGCCVEERAFALCAFEEAVKFNQSSYNNLEQIKNIIIAYNLKDEPKSLTEFYSIILKNSKGNIMGMLGFANNNGLLKTKLEESQFELFVLSQLSRAMEIKQADDVRKKYEFIVNASGSFMTLINSSYIYEAANNAFVNSHKLKREEVIGKSIADIWGKKDFDSKIKGYFDKALEGETINYQAWLETKKTGLLCYDITYYPYQNELGEYTHVVVVSRDITLLVKAEEMVRKLNLAIEQTDEIIFITDIEGIITYVNPSFEKTYGYSKNEVLGKRTSLLKSGLFDEEEYKKMWATLISGKPYRGEMVNRLKSGEFIEVENSINPFFDSYNNVLGFIAVQRDITERKKIEKALKEAKELAERSDKLKGEFLSQLSHEIRTPLNSLLNSIQFIREDLSEHVTEDSNILFDSIINSAKRIIRTVHMIVNISELQTGNYEYVQKYVDIGLIAEKKSKEFKEPAEQKDLEFVFINNLENSKIFCDEFSVEQIITQLLDNAVKFTDKGTIEFTLDKNKFSELTLKIRDTGIGISEEYLPNMYQVFSQEQQGYTRKYDGNGLGLALVKKYCEINNAEIFCTSQKNLGTEFVVVFNNSKV